MHFKHEAVKCQFNVLPRTSLFPSFKCGAVFRHAQDVLVLIPPRKGLITSLFPSFKCGAVYRHAQDVLVLSPPSKGLTTFSFVSFKSATFNRDDTKLVRELGVKADGLCSNPNSEGFFRASSSENG
jgi:hypothetical protein